jgi:hypothetical protein
MSLPARVALPKLVLAAGPVRVSLRLGGKRVQQLGAGTYVVDVRDRSTRCGIQLRGTGVSRGTSAPFRGTRTWRLRLVKGTLTVGCASRPPAQRVRVVDV